MSARTAKRPGRSVVHTRGPQTLKCPSGPRLTWLRTTSGLYTSRWAAEGSQRTVYQPMGRQLPVFGPRAVSGLSPADGLPVKFTSRWAEVLVVA
jgi:hypothetical protein